MPIASVMTSLQKNGVLLTLTVVCLLTLRDSICRSCYGISTATPCTGQLKLVFPFLTIAWWNLSARCPRNGKSIRDTVSTYSAKLWLKIYLLRLLGTEANWASEWKNSSGSPNVWISCKPHQLCSNLSMFLDCNESFAGKL